MELFAFRLCLAIGCPHPDQLSDWITAEQFRGWLAFWEKEPWGDQRADQRQAAASLWGLAPHVGSNVDLPELMYPYFEDSGPEAMAARAVSLDEKIRNLEREGKAPWQRPSPSSRST